MRSQRRGASRLRACALQLERSRPGLPLHHARSPREGLAARLGPGLEDAVGITVMTTPSAASTSAAVQEVSPAARLRDPAKPAPAFEQQRRLRPRLWDTDWMVLRGMRAAIDHLADRIATPGKVALDFG